MRRAVLILGLTTMLGALAPGAHAQVGSQDLASGQGRTAPIGLGDPIGSITIAYEFDFDATSGPSGEAPSGYASLDVLLQGSPSFHVEGPVTCLSVSANDAVIGFEVDPDKSNFTTPGAVFQVTDNGPLGADPPDVFLPGPVPDPESCAPRVPAAPSAVSAGDITVIDAPPRPTSKSDCRKGGYERYGFRNQDQCVAVVNGAGP